MRASKYQLKRLGRKGLSLLMAMTMCLSLIQISVFADTDIQIQTTNQISNAWDGGAVYYTGTGAVGNSGNWAVRLSRTLTATGTENLFNVNMEVVTKNEEVQVTNADAAVVLVLDTSGSMRFCSECGYDPGNSTLGNHNRPGTYTSCSNRTSRLAAAKAAVAAFLDGYAEVTNTSAQRYVSLVTFSSNAAAQQITGSNYWVNVSGGVTDVDLTNAKNKITNLSASGGTNTEGGFQLAYNLLRRSELPSNISNKYVIFLSDGEPTFHISGSAPNNAGSMSFTGTQGGGSWSMKSDWQDLKTIADQITSTSTSGGNAAMYSLLYGDTASADLYANDGQRSNGNPSSSNYVQTNVAALFNTFNKRPATGNILTPTTSDQLNTIFQNILNSQETSGSTTNGVTAAIGDLIGGTAPAYTFIGFNNADGSGLVLNGGTPATSYNGASVTGNALDWDLDDAEAVPSSSTTTYTLSYQVRLNNNIQSFLDWNESSADPAAEYSVGDATLSYTYTPASSTPSTPTVAFPVVKAHGYLGAFDFMKIAHHKNATGGDIPLAGAPFQLTNSANAPLYVQAGAITQNTTSQADVENQTLGEVAFTGIPSGYAYTLSETGEFTYNEQIYTPTNDTWNVSVSYGVVSGAPSGSVENMLKQIDDYLTLTKIWRLAPGSNTQSITVNLYQGQDQNASPVATLTLNGSSASITKANPSDTYQVAYVSGHGTTQWVYKLTVPTINQETGGRYSYRIDEDSLGEDIDSKVDGMTITNITTGTTSVSVEKKWALIDGQDPSAAMPDVKVQLTRTSQTVTTSQNVGTVVTLGKDQEHGWSYTWLNLDAYDGSGQPYTYAVTESEGNHQYIKTVKEGNQFTLYNHALNGSVEKTVTKTWNDENPAGRTPITVTLNGSDGQTYTAEMGPGKEGTTVNGNTWSYTFKQLPQYQLIDDANSPGGVKLQTITYTVSELTDVSGYTSVTDGNLGLINTRSQNVTIQVEKIWDDKDYSFDHDEVVIILSRNGTEIAEQTTVNGVAVFETVDDGNDNPQPLPQFDPATGAAYDYTVSESPVPSGYTPSYDYGTDNTVVAFDDDTHIGSVTVTNTLNTDDTKIQVQVTKNWMHPSGTTPPPVTFTLYQAREDGEPVALRTGTLDSGNTYTFNDLLKYYYVQESVVTTDPETNEPTTETVVQECEYQYTVTESALTDYNNGQPAEAVPEGDNQFSFTNVRTGAIQLTVNKVWNDVDASARPEATIKLQRASAVEDGVQTFTDVPGSEPLTTKIDGSKTWTVDQFDDDGQAYIYKVVENTVSAYSTAYTATGTSETTDTYSAAVGSITVTNTLSPVSDYTFNASKTWVDNGNAANTRESITLTLLRNNAAQGTVVIGADGVRTGGTYPADKVSVNPDPSNPNKWIIQFTGLEKYYTDSADGRVKVYTYSVTETLQANSAYVQNNGTMDIVNTLKQGGIDIPLHKVWVDPATTQHTASITFSLTATNAGGQTVTSVGGNTLPTGVTLGFSGGAVTPKASDAADAVDATETGDDWYYTFTNLPLYDDNQSKITYTVAEVTDLVGYTKAKTDNANLFTNTIQQESLTFTGTKTWNMAAQDTGDYLNPGPQPVTIGLYYVNADGSLGQRVTMNGLSNPVIVTPDDGTFKFEGLPRYNGSGEENRYVVREVEVTASQSGEPGYTPIDNGGFITLYVTDNSDKTYDYKYTVGYTGDNDTTVTNTYEDPQVYFYQIIGNYYTYLSGAPSSSDTGVNLTGTDEGYVAIPSDELISNIITAIPGNYTSRGGENYTFTGSDDDAKVSLDSVNHMYTITLNYERHLYTLQVNHVFVPETDRPTDTDGTYDDYTDPNPYLGNATYSNISKGAPTGFKITNVTVKNSDGPESTEAPNYNGGNFLNHDVTVTYYYAKDVNPISDETDAKFTIHKIEKIDENDEIDEETETLITHDSADFQVYTDAECTTPVDGKLFSTSTGTGPDAGTVTIKASNLGAGTWYLKEVQAPSGYAAEDTVWQAEVTRSAFQELEDGQFVNYIVWTLAVTVNGENALTGEGDDLLLVVPNTRQYGYLTITKAVTGLEQNETKTFQFDVSGNNNGSIYDETHSITVTGNSTVSLTAVKVPIGTYVVTEDSSSAAINGYDLEITSSTDTGVVAVSTQNDSDNPAEIIFTNKYDYGDPQTNLKTIEGKKLWVDDNNRDGLRPASITVQLFHNNEPISGKTADVDTTGDGAFTIKYDSYLYPGAITVKEIGYTDAQGYHEGTVPDYDMTEGALGNGYTVTNTHQPETIFVQANKSWASGTPQAVTLRLSANGTEKAVLVLDGTEDAQETSPWAGEFPGTFPKYENGALINYTVTEDSLGGNWSYTIDKSAISDGGEIYGYHFTVTNSYSSGGGGDTSYYYRIDYVYTGYGADGSTIYHDAVTGGVQTTGSSAYSFTAADSANHGGYAFSLTSDANLSASLAGTSRSNPYVFTVYYEFTELEDGGTPTGETPDTGTTPDQPIDIPDVAVPKAEVPATGDTLALWIMAAAVSGVGLVWLALIDKKRREDENS